MTVRGEFDELIGSFIAYIGDRALDKELEQDLDRRFPGGGKELSALRLACLAGIGEGWICSREGGGIRFGRVTKPSDATGGFSVDVVDMNDVRGPHHSHPNGEIDLVIPLDAGAMFDGKGAGWLVYGPGSAHSPTVTAGRALIVYLLPAGSIEFSR